MAGERPTIILHPPKEGAIDSSKSDTQPIQSQDSATKLSRISDQKIAFIQRAFASGADESLHVRRRILLAHAVTKPHLTLQELAPFAGVSTSQRVLAFPIRDFSEHSCTFPADTP